jgi:methyl-accepting chemotaxis protein
MDKNDDDQIAKAIETLAVHVKYLGVGDAATTMGAIEYLATKVGESGHEIARGLGNLAEAVQEAASALGEIADAVKEKNNKLGEIADAIEDAATKPWERMP